MNTTYRIVRNASTGKWVVASELAKGRKKNAARAAGLAVAMAMMSAGGNAAFAASTGNGAIQLCEGAKNGNHGYAIGYGSTQTTTDKCDDGAELSFFMYNNASGSDGVQGWKASDANISGYKDGRLEIVGKGGLTLNGPITFDSDASMQSHKITSLADGTLSDTSKDAVTGAQLYATNQNVSNNASDITALKSELGNGSIGPVQQAGAGQAITVAGELDGDTVDFTGKKAGVSQSRKLTGLGDGELSSTSKDAVTGAQLYAIHQKIGTNADNISSLQTQISIGAVGLVQQDGDGQAITVASGLDGDTVDFTGKKDGVSLSRKLTGVTDGTVSSTSKDAVTGAQLYATNKKVSANTDNITALQNQINGGSLGLVKQDATTHAITVAGATGGTSIDVAGTDGVRVLSGVANGTADHDAVTVAQLKAAGLVNPDGKPALAMVYDDLAMGSATLGGAEGTVLHNLGNGTIAQGSMEAVNGGQLFDVQQDVQQRMDALNGQFDTLNAQVSHIQQGLDDGSMGGGGGSGSGTDSAVLGHGAQASGSGSMAMGVNADASGDDSMASGTRAIASGTGATASGVDAIASDTGSTASGSGAQATGDHSTATGSNAIASGSNSTANGNGAQATGDNSMASGAQAVASGAGSTALGANASATGNNAVALGANSVADRDDSVSVGSAGNERQITHVAAGTQRTDAANWGQVQDAVQGVQDWTNRRLERIDHRIDRMGAMSAAYAQMAFSATGVNTPNRLGVGIGVQHGKTAVALGVSHQLSPKVSLSFGGSASGKEASVGVGLAIGW